MDSTPSPPPPPPQLPAIDANTLPLGNVWLVGVLSLIIVSFMGCLCSFFFYYKMNYWRRTATANHMVASLTAASFGNASVSTIESLPNYTLVSGLPSYDEALAEYQRARFYLSYRGHYFTYSGRMRSKRGSINELLENCKRRASTAMEPPQLSVAPGHEQETVV